MIDKIVEYIENSFLKDLLKEDSITDISYNGETVYYKDNLKGRLKSDLSITKNEAYSFIRQIANLTDSLFSYTNPILDVSVGRYRINATHSSISRKNREKTTTFSIRIGYEKLRIKDNDGFINPLAYKLINFALKSNNSIVISGKTGTGKTEFQKYLLSKLPPFSRIITIDNINELETDYFVKDIDSLTWLNRVSENSKVDIDALIKNALRSTPDWLIVGEARGKEMLTLLSSVMSGHPTITTLHSKRSEFTYKRMARMAMIGNESLIYEETLSDIYDHFKLIVHLNSYYDFEKKMYVRYVDEIGTNCNSVYKKLYVYPNEFDEINDSFKKDFELNELEYNSYNDEVRRTKTCQNIWYIAYFV